MGRLFVALVFCLVGAQALAGVRIKDISTLQGVRDNQLIGYGLVVGLQGAGDTLRNAPFTEQAMQSMLDRLGINVRNTTLRTRNVAAVIVTADLPPEAGVGSRIDVTVSSLGDATSLMGGTLVLTTLSGADGQTYAVAQGAVAVTGYDVAGQAETLSQGVPTAGRISNGALIEKSLPPMRDSPVLTLELRNPDYKTAVRIADAINDYARDRFHKRVAYAQDFRTVTLFRPPETGVARFMSEIGDLQVEPDMTARVVLDARTGTIVIGQDVQISTVAVTHGTLSVRVSETPTASQPAPLSNGKTVVTPKTEIETNQEGGPLAVVGGTSLRSLVAGLNRIGLKPPGIIARVQASKTAGSLQADLVVQ
ncbi:MAG: flagellar basal body P-ring protein FlgI [Roseiarcus sp.]